MLGIVLLLLLLFFFFLPKFYCNTMSIRDVNLCTNLNKKNNLNLKPGTFTCFFFEKIGVIIQILIFLFLFQVDVFHTRTFIDTKWISLYSFKLSIRTFVATNWRFDCKKSLYNPWIKVRQDYNCITPLDNLGGQTTF